MKTIIALALTFAVSFTCYGQAVLTLDECYDAARTHYPLSRQRDLLERTNAFTVENAAKGSLPRIQVGAQATYQSEVTQIPIEMPGVEPLSKDQYRVYGEIAQTLYQGGMTRYEQDAAALQGSVDQAQLDVDLYQLEDRINDLFFGTLLLQEQQRQTALMKADLDAALKKINAALANGTALPSSADVLRAELLKVEQRLIEMRAAEALFRQLLSAFIGRPVAADTQLARPEFAGQPSSLQRPEQALFAFQRRRIESSQALLSARKKPRLELFVQGGYGRPGLNMLEDEFGFYYLGGVRLAWQLSGYYTFRRERDILELRRQSIDVQEQAFVFNTELELDRHSAEVEKLRRLIEIDDDIIALRMKVRKAAAAQLEEGVISATDFISEANAEDQARQNRVLHETQLLSAQADYQFTAGRK